MQNYSENLSVQSIDFYMLPWKILYRNIKLPVSVFKHNFWSQYIFSPRRSQ